MTLFNFGRVPIYSLDISDQSFKFLRLFEASGGFVVKSFGEAEIDKGVLSGGEIKDKNRFSDILREVFLKNEIKFVAVSLPEEKSFLREIRISDVGENELSSVLEFQIEEHVPLPSAETLFDFTVVRKESNYFDLVVNAFPKNFVESYLDIIGSAGALPVIAESELQSSGRSIMPKGFLETSMVVDWGKTRASFSIFENGILIFASTANVGGENLENSISKSLGVGKGEALKIKLKADIMDPQGSPQLLNAILPVVSSFADEIRKILDYWQGRPGSETGVEKIFLSGGDSNLLGLSEYLEKELGVSVSLANPWANVNFSPKYLPPIKFKDSLRFSSAIGLGLKALEKEKIW